MRTPLRSPRIDPEPLVVHLAHYRSNLSLFQGVPARVNADWMLFLPLQPHRFHCPLGVREGLGPSWYLIPPGFPFAAQQQQGYEHYSAHFSSAGYVGWEQTVAASHLVDDSSWPVTTLRENPVTLRLADASWRLVNDVRDRHDLITAFSRLIACYRAGDQFRSRISLLQLLERAIAGDAADPLERIRPFADYLTFRVHEALSISELARSCGISRMHLHRCCLKAYGAAPREVILRERLGLSQQLLASGVGVHAAGAASGFEDPYYFSRIFSRRMGCPPSRWQLSHQEPSGQQRPARARTPTP
jgi:AraC-like DNA-binding protein